MSDVMAIGRYQLENLIRSGVKFTFFNLASEQVSGKGDELANAATRIGASEVLSRLQTDGAAPDSAVVLICEDGVKSKQVAQQLEQAGFMNVYRVEGGFAAL